MYLGMRLDLHTEYSYSNSDSHTIGFEMCLGMRLDLHAGSYPDTHTIGLKCI